MTDPQLTIGEIVPGWFTPVFLGIVIVGSITNNALVAYSAGLSAQGARLRSALASPRSSSPASSRRSRRSGWCSLPRFLDTMEYALELAVSILGPLDRDLRGRHRAAPQPLRRPRPQRRASRQPVLVLGRRVLARRDRPGRRHRDRGPDGQHDPLHRARSRPRWAAPTSPRSSARSRRRLYAVLWLTTKPFNEPRDCAPARNTTSNTTDATGVRRATPWRYTDDLAHAQRDRPARTHLDGVPLRGPHARRRRRRAAKAYAAGRRSPTPSPSSSPSRWSSTRPSTSRARRMLEPEIELVETPARRLLDARLRPDLRRRRRAPGRARRGRLDLQRLGRPELGAVGASPAKIARFVAEARRRRAGQLACSSTRAAASTSTARAPCCSPRPCSSTRAATRTPTRQRVEAEMRRTLGATKAIWLPRGLTRDYEDFGTSGHVDIVATIPRPEAAAAQPARPGAPRLRGERELRARARGGDGCRGPPLRDHRAARARHVLRDDEGFVDWSYVNHLVVNGGVIACGFGEDGCRCPRPRDPRRGLPGPPRGDGRRAADLRRGGGIHCITQQQPRSTA